MRCRYAIVLMGLLCATASTATFGREAKDSRRPNVVLILADNQGAWTLGCYGNPDIRTPHIDRLAAQGMRFTRAFSPNGVCSPTRASLLTGLLPSQHGVHSYLGANEAQMGPDAYSTIAEFRSLPEILAGAGYTCGLSGKWHLGANATPQEGFTSWITMPHGHTETFYGAEVIEEGRVRKEPGYLTDLWTDRAVRFLEENRDRPFFLYLAYNGPYNLGESLKQPGRNRHAAEYANALLLSFPRDGVHPWLVANKAYLNNIVAMRRVATETSGVDDGVGTVLDALDRLGLADNTVVIYTADQGWVGGQNGLWGMSDHTRPLSAFDGMMHIPLIIRHPGHVAAGSTADLMVSGYDLMPMLLSYLGLGDRMAVTPKSPGRDFSPVLRGQSITWEHVVYFEQENVRAIRTADWKYIHRHPDGPFELYDLATDPGEKVNLYGQPGRESIRDTLRGRLDAFFRDYADPKYDLYHGGGSKTHLLS
ncbi:MAG: sulfatase-like hydrolase/transferase, partial [Isosphaeraceae bacterium]|nr:sulfatase-like hydrolase/transferase [Isosphaeraceae bacterium]